VELENLRREPVEKSEYILANEESKNKELLLDDELQRLRLTLSEKHKEESDKLHVKIHQLEDEVLKLNSLVNETLKLFVSFPHFHIHVPSVLLRGLYNVLSTHH
jgi:hypothetical protein